MNMSSRDRYILIAVVLVGALARLLVPGAVAQARGGRAARQGHRRRAAAARPVQAGEGHVRAGAARLPADVREPRAPRQGRPAGRGRAVAAGAAEPRRGAGERGLQVRRAEARPGRARARARAPARLPASAAAARPARREPLRGCDRRHGRDRRDRDQRHAQRSPRPSSRRSPSSTSSRAASTSLEKLIHNINELVERRNQELAISGRLITIEGFAMKRGKVTVLATSYMLPADQGLFGGRDPAGPGRVDPAAPQAASAGSAPPAPPTAAVTSP